jgi:hypothetical protein
MLFIKYSGLGTNNFLIVILYFLIIDSLLINAIAVLLKSTRFTVLI